MRRTRPTIAIRKGSSMCATGSGIRTAAYIGIEVEVALQVSEPLAELVTLLDRHSNARCLVFGRVASFATVRPAPIAAGRGMR
jgi:hypothetical protein